MYLGIVLEYSSQYLDLTSTDWEATPSRKWSGGSPQGLSGRQLLQPFLALATAVDDTCLVGRYLPSHLIVASSCLSRRQPRLRSDGDTLSQRAPPATPCLRTVTLLRNHDQLAADSSPTPPMRPCTAPPSPDGPSSGVCGLGDRQVHDRINDMIRYEYDTFFALLANIRAVRRRSFAARATRLAGAFGGTHPRSRAESAEVALCFSVQGTSRFI